MESEYFYLNCCDINSWNHSILSFLNAHGIVDEATLISFFTSAGAPRNVPFPSMIHSQRFKLNRNPNLNAHCRQAFSMKSYVRESFAGLLTELRLLNNVLFYGAVGCGKSHILAEYVIYLYCRRSLGLTHSPRVMYIPTLNTNVKSLDQIVVSALKYCFPECTSHLELPETQYWSIEQKMMYCKQATQDYAIVGVFDDWNNWDAQTDAAKLSVKGLLTDYVSCSILGWTAAFVNHSQFVDCSCVECSVGLTDAEVSVWRNQIPYNIILGGSDKDVLVGTTVKHLTGFNPLILTTICSYTMGTSKVPVNDLVTAMQFYDNDIQLWRLGGAVMAQHLKEFIDNCPDKKNLVMVMSKVLSADSFNDVNEFIHLFPHGYFRYNRSSHSLSPICGWVARCIDRYLLRSDRSLHRQLWSETCICAALRSENTAERDFVFGCYVINLIASNTEDFLGEEFVGLDVSIHEFDGAFSDSIVEISGSGASLFVPFNSFATAGYVDCVLRVNRDTQNYRKRRRSRCSVIVQNVSIYYIRITTNLPSRCIYTFQHFALDAADEASGHKYRECNASAKMLLITPHNHDMTLPCTLDVGAKIAFGLKIWSVVCHSCLTTEGEEANTLNA